MENRLSVDSERLELDFIGGSPVYHVAELPFKEGGEDWHNDATPIKPTYREFEWRQGVIVSAIVLANLLAWMTVLTLVAWWLW